jgi:predicted nicotinamide N-methyase
VLQDIRDHLTLSPVPLAPEVRLYQADEPIGLWELTEQAGAGDEGPSIRRYSSDAPPPFWAFAWAGGQALARYLLDNPGTVRGRHVLDLATGSGLVAIAAAKAAAAHVQALDIDPLAMTAVELNAEANGVDVAPRHVDVLDESLEPDVTVVTAGDVFYSQAMSTRMLRFMGRANRAGATILVGDPGRAFFPHGVFEEVARYDVPVSDALESATVKSTGVYRLL